MRDNKFLASTSFILFVLSAGITLVFVFFSSIFGDLIENPGGITLIVGAFSLLAMILGFLSFKVPQAKVGGIGGLVLLLLVLLITPVSRVSTITPQTAADGQGKAFHTGNPEIDGIIDTLLAGNRQKELALLQFSLLPCTRAEGLGGPPKCRKEEAEGTQVEAFPILGPEGHHLRRDETERWNSIRASVVYAVYRVSENVYSDEAFPAGEYAIVFLVENETYLVTAQVTDGKIVRLDYNLGDPSEINLNQVASEIILEPSK